MKDMMASLCGCGCGITVYHRPLSPARLKSRGEKRYVCGHQFRNNAHQRGSRSPTYKTGREISHGYIIRTGQYEHPMAYSKGRIAEHRMVMADHLGRLLSRDETVHHINGNRQDNRIENLMVVSRSEHPHLHPKPTRVRPDFICLTCGKPFRRRGRRVDVHPPKSCSRKCDTVLRFGGK